MLLITLNIRIIGLDGEVVKMSLACKCDRCQKFFSPEKREDRSIKIMVSLVSLLDLCDSCAETLKLWLNEYKEGDNKDEKK